VFGDAHTHDRLVRDLAIGAHAAVVFPECADNVGRSTAAISPLMVAVGLAGGLYTATAVSNAALDRTASGTAAAPDIGAGTVALLIGGPVLLAVFGSTTTIFRSGRSREREFALIQVAGGTTATVLAATGWEAPIYAATAVAFGSASVAVTTMAGLWLEHRWEFGAPAVGSIAGLGLLLILAATVLPTASALRTEMPRTLAAE
jgi:putative ABC transport system permease protein